VNMLQYSSRSSENVRLSISLSTPYIYTRWIVELAIHQGQ
jgi:hypothetical protein